MLRIKKTTLFSLDPTVKQLGELGSLSLARCVGYKEPRSFCNSSFPILHSKCTGITSSSEDSSELWFLLVENYNYLTAPVGLRFGWEFLNP
jgi:hypothetical protein